MSGKLGKGKFLVRAILFGEQPMPHALGSVTRRLQTPFKVTTSAVQDMARFVRKNPGDAFDRIVAVINTATAISSAMTAKQEHGTGKTSDLQFGLNLTGALAGIALGPLTLLRPFLSSAALASANSSAIAVCAFAGTGASLLSLELSIIQRVTGDDTASVASSNPLDGVVGTGLSVANLYATLDDTCGACLAPAWGRAFTLLDLLHGQTSLPGLLQTTGARLWASLDAAAESFDPEDIDVMLGQLD